LHERFNEYALVFLQKAMESLLGKQLNLDYLENKIQGIKRILIKDSVKKISFLSLPSKSQSGSIHQEKE
jgi:hypothetical protein